LEIEKDAVLKGSQDTNDYPWIDTRIAGFEMKWPAALLNADGLANLQLTGAGTLDGSGERWWREYWDARKCEKDDLDPHFKVPRPRLAHIIRCQNVAVRDLSLKDSAFWNLQFTYCEGVEVYRLKIRAPHEPVKAASSDGIDTRTKAVGHKNRTVNAKVSSRRHSVRQKWRCGNEAASARSKELAKKINFSQIDRNLSYYRNVPVFCISVVQTLDRVLKRA
jgi:polygalacturonase